MSSDNSKTDEAHVKEQMTTHWDLDYLSREDLEAEMAKGMGESRRMETGNRRSRSEAHPDSNRGGRDNTETSTETDADIAENPLRIGLGLLAAAAVMVVVGVLLLRAGA